MNLLKVVCLGVVCLGLVASSPLVAQEPKPRATLQVQEYDLRYCSVAFSPDGKTLAAVGTTINRLWDVATGKEKATLKRVKKTKSGRWRSVRTARRWPRAGSDKTIKLWDVATGKEQATLKGHRTLSSSPWRSVRTARRWPRGVPTPRSSCGTWRRARSMATLKGHIERRVSAVAFSPDGKTLASGSYDKTIKLWDVATGKRRPPSRDTDGFSHFRGVQSGRQDAGLGEWGQDDQAVGRGDGQGDRPPSRGTTNQVWSVAFSPDGKTLASGSYDKTIKLWDVATSKERPPSRGMTDEVKSVAFSPDGKTLASESADKTTRLWDMTTDK